jgi:hypothetical protein
MDEREFKKLLIDLGLTISAVARAVGVSRWAINKYFRGELRDPTRRAQIRGFLASRARAVGVRLPRFWLDSKAA